MSLQSLEDHNKQALDRAFKKKMHPGLTGIACPQCGNELHYSEPDVILTSSPPQKRIKCFACNFVGNCFL